MNSSTIAQHRVLIVGVGSIGERHTRCFQETGRAAVAICESLPDRRQSVAERYGLGHSYDSINRALDDFSPTSAVIASPAPTHLPIAVTLAEAGVHLLIEKPLSLSLTGIDELTSLVGQNQLVSAVGYCWRFHPLLERAHEFLSDGRFGHPLEIVFQSGQCFPYYRPAYREIYYNDRATGGGAIQDAITHALNAGEWFAGPIRSLAADARHQHLEGVTVEDTVHVITRQGSDAPVMGSYSLNQYQPANEVNWSIVCEEGMVRIEVGRNRWMWQDRPESDWNITPGPELDRDAMYVTQAQGFLDAIEGKCPPRCSLAEGLQTLKVNLAVLDDVDHHRSLKDIE